MVVVDLARAQAAQERLVTALADHPDVNGIGIARAVSGGYVLKVNVRTEHGSSSIPVEVDGVAVEVNAVGPIRKRQSA